MSEHSRREFLKAGLAAAASALPAVGATEDPGTFTLKQASDLIRRREASSVQLTEACLKRIDAYNPSLNAFITITRDQALATAREMDAELKNGKWRGPLHGIPVALKDNIDTAGIRTTAASGVFKDRVPMDDAEVVVRLKKAGAIFLGKLNLHEFALGGTSAVTYFGPVRIRTSHRMAHPTPEVGRFVASPGDKSLLVSSPMAFELHRSQAPQRMSSLIAAEAPVDPAMLQKSKEDPGKVEATTGRLRSTQFSAHSSE